MTDPTILFVRPGAIKAADKKALHQAGVIVIEVADPSEVKLVRAHAELSASDLLCAAASAIDKAYYDNVRVTFARAICAAIERAHSTTQSKDDQPRQPQ